MTKRPKMRELVTSTQRSIICGPWPTDEDWQIHWSIGVMQDDDGTWAVVERYHDTFSIFLEKLSRSKAWLIAESIYENNLCCSFGDDVLFERHDETIERYLDDKAAEMAAKEAIQEKRRGTIARKKAEREML